MLTHLALASGKPELKNIYHCSFSRNEPVCESDLDGEEEFYYTEIEVPIHARVRPLPRLALPASHVVTLQPVTSPTSTTSSPPPPTTTRDVTYIVARQPADTARRFNLEGATSKVLLPTLADHMDMARPPHENPEYLVQTGFKTGRPNQTPVVSEPFQPPATFSTVQAVQAAVPIAIPVTNFSFSAPASSSVSPIRFSLTRLAVVALNSKLASSPVL